MIDTKEIEKIIDIFEKVASENFGGDVKFKETEREILTGLLKNDALPKYLEVATMMWIENNEEACLVFPVWAGYVEGVFRMHRKN